ncbi:Hypothetical predicted protein [Pelobates cultripes]|uniref:Secreted protein n=1 Tax=Pelobates cultripes TaxID=61616 RepID=A0AAD1SZ27_PELCU|nr:Hypothetical predicted protein [Pelobates cultripes]
MAAAPTKHMLHCEIMFQAVFNALCVAFTSAVTMEASSSVPTACNSPRLRAKKSKHPTQPAPVVKPTRRSPTRRHPARRRSCRSHLPACGSSTQADQRSTEY